MNTSLTNCFPQLGTSHSGLPAVNLFDFIVGKLCSKVFAPALPKLFLIFFAWQHRLLFYSRLRFRCLADDYQLLWADNHLPCLHDLEYIDAILQIGFSSVVCSTFAAFWYACCGKLTRSCSNWLIISIGNYRGGAWAHLMGFDKVWTGWQEHNCYLVYWGWSVMINFWCYYFWYHWYSPLAILVWSCCWPGSEWWGLCRGCSWVASSTSSFGSEWRLIALKWDCL